MFFYTVYRSSLWKNVDKKSRPLRVGIVGSIGYILLHSYLYSGYINLQSTVAKYRHTIYFLIILDIILIAHQLLFKREEKKKIKKYKSIPEVPIFMAPSYIQQSPKSIKKRVNNAKKKFIKKTQKKINIQEINIPIYKSKKVIFDDDIPIYKTCKSGIQ